MIKLTILWLTTFALTDWAQGEFYEDRRCVCVCPPLKNKDPASKVLVLQENVPLTHCNCAGVVMPRVKDYITGNKLVFCLLCECKYQERNTAMMLVVVVTLCWGLGYLTIYMINLAVLRFLGRRRDLQFDRNVQETLILLGGDEDSDTSDSDFNAN